MPNRAFVRFRNVTVPYKAAVNFCYAQITAYATSSDLVNTRVGLANDADPEVPVNYQQLQDIEVVSWVAWPVSESWTDGEVYNTPDLSTQLQVILAKAEWTSGNSVLMIIEDDGSSNTREFSAVEHEGGSEAAQLRIEYTAVETDNPAAPLEFVPVSSGEEYPGVHETTNAFDFAKCGFSATMWVSAATLPNSPQWIGWDFGYGKGIVAKQARICFGYPDVKVKFKIQATNDANADWDNDNWYDLYYDYTMVTDGEWTYLYFPENNSKFRRYRLIVYKVWEDDYGGFDRGSVYVDDIIFGTIEQWDAQDPHPNTADWYYGS